MPSDFPENGTPPPRPVASSPSEVNTPAWWGSAIQAAASMPKEGSGTSASHSQLGSTSLVGRAWLSVTICFVIFPGFYLGYLAFNKMSIDQATYPWLRGWAAVALAVAVCHGYSRHCPKCGNWWASRVLDQTLVDAKDDWKTIRDTQTGVDRVVPVRKEVIENHHICSVCSHQWETLSRREWQK